MGLMDKVKKILFDDDDTDDLPVRTDKVEKKEKKVQEEVSNDLFEEIEKEAGGVVIHNEVDEDTITEVKVPVEKNDSFIFPVKVDDEDISPKEEINDTQQLRLKEDEFDRTQELERLREKNLTRSREDYIKEYTESRKMQKEVVAKRDFSDVPEKKEKGPYKVPPVISPVFGILDKNYDPNTIEETKQQITMTNSGNATKISERQFGPVSFNDQGIPAPRIVNKTVIITATVDPSENLKEELKKEQEKIKETNAIEDEIINSIINDEIETHDSIEDAFEDIEKIEPVKEPIIEEPVEEPTIEFETPKKKTVELPTIDEVEEETTEEESDEVITGSPYDDILEDYEEQEELKPTNDINDVIDQVEEMEEADVTPDAPKNIEDNENLDDTIETDLYNLIDSMYKDEE